MTYTLASTTTIKRPFILDNSGKLVPELAETLAQYTTFTVLKFLTRTPKFPSLASSLFLGSHTEENPGTQLIET